MPTGLLSSSFFNIFNIFSFFPPIFSVSIQKNKILKEKDSIILATRWTRNNFVKGGLNYFLRVGAF